MKILYVNCVCGVGSTGRIVTELAELAKKKGHTVKVACSTVAPIKGVSSDELIVVGSKLDYYMHNAMSRLTDHEGLYSKIATKKLIRQIREFDPDLVHLHNLHGHWINYELLFKYIADENKRVIWTLHDCWAFTGHCAYFSIVNCQQWKYECKSCANLKIYPQCIGKGDVSNNFVRKKGAFTSINDMTIVTPSKWLAELVKQSYLKEYPVRVINNGIDLSVFRPIESDFRQRHGIAEDKFVLLGVAYGWGERKGLDVFIELSKRLDDRFQIVLVGTDDKVDKQLPESIISIHRTDSQIELAKIYTAADLFVNPTREEVLGMVNLEANACGTPVLTFRTGGSPECICDKSGAVVEKDDIDAMEREIRNICFKGPFSHIACINRASSFDMNNRFEEYINLYNTNV